MTKLRSLRRRVSSALLSLTIALSAGTALAYTVEECDEMYNWAIQNICSKLSSSGARRRCYEDAMDNYARCLADASRGDDGGGCSCGGGGGDDGGGGGGGNGSG
jgi:hypothetical protein